MVVVKLCVDLHREDDLIVVVGNDNEYTDTDPLWRNNVYAANHIVEKNFAIFCNQYHTRLYRIDRTAFLSEADIKG